MHPSSHHPHHPNLFTTRHNKLSSTCITLNPSMQNLHSPHDELLSTRHSHRKYKLSHSQIDKLDKLSAHGQMKWKIRKEGLENKLETSESIDNINDDNVIKQSPKLSSPKSQSNFHHHTSSNYHVRKDQLIHLQNNNNNQQLSLHIEIITFQIPSSPTNSQNKTIDVICFQIHVQQINCHFRSQFTFQTLPPQVRVVFDNIDELFDHVTDQEERKYLRFDKIAFNIQFTVRFRKISCIEKKQSCSQHNTCLIKLHLLPFAVIQIVQNNHAESFVDQQKKQLHKTITDLNKDLETQQNLIHALRAQNDNLKQKLYHLNQQFTSIKEQKQLLHESYDKISKASQVNREFFFQFVPDPKAKNYSNFTFKTTTNTLKKQKNDLKWDQISSQAPLPKSSRHYFTFTIQNFHITDFMFGIVTLKGKDTLNAFLGLEVICLYMSKNNMFVYEQGKHYKISRSVVRGYVVIVVVDREKGVIEWMKKKEKIIMSNNNDKNDKNDKNTQSSNSKQDYLPQQQQTSLPNSTTKPSSTNPNPPKVRKSSQTIPNEKVSSYIVVNQQYIPPQYQPNEIEYIHSTKIPQQMLAHDLFAYLEVYNINQPIRLNDKK